MRKIFKKESADNEYSSWYYWDMVILGRGVECASKTKCMIWNLRQYLQEEHPSGVTILTEGAPVCSVDDAAALER